MADQPAAIVEQELAVLFADVCGSTRLYEVLGDASALATIRGCLAVVERATLANAGRVVKTIGDEVMAVFPDCAAAAQAAFDMQTQVEALPAAGVAPVRIRVGFNFGLVLENPQDGDVFGDTVNVASRLAKLARAGQIFAAEATAKGFPPQLRGRTRLLDGVPLKGKAEDVRMVEILWQDGVDATQVVSRVLAERPRGARLRLDFQGRELILDALGPALTLGRNARADLVIVTPTTSRLHAVIEARRERFVLIDQSTNGTYVAIHGETEVRVLREELLLRKSGSISLGQSGKKDPASAVRFVCEG